MTPNESSVLIDRETGNLSVYRIRKPQVRDRTVFVEAPIEFFGTSILKLPKKNSVRQFLCKNWRDLRLAIEESWDPHYPSEGIPFKLTARFVQNVLRPKNSVEAVLAAQEKLG
jgi:hypothetical protein